LALPFARMVRNMAAAAAGRDHRHDDPRIPVFRVK
jgi:hypothetical protein